MSTVHCPTCDASIPEGSRFCTECGTSLAGTTPASATKVFAPAPCHRCGHTNVDGGLVCAECGTRLTSPGVTTSGGFSTGSPFDSPDVAATPDAPPTPAPEAPGTATPLPEAMATPAAEAPATATPLPEGPTTPSSPGGDTPAATPETATPPPAPAYTPPPPPLSGGTQMFVSAPVLDKGVVHRLLPEGRVESVDVDPEVVIGRASGQLQVDEDPYLSDAHARIRREGVGFVVEDLDSVNGTFVRLSGDHALQPGDLVMIGSQLFEFTA